MKIDIEETRKKNTEFYYALRQAEDSGILDSNEVRKRLSMRKKEIIKKHEANYSIWQGSGKDKRWFTRLPDGSPKGKKVSKTRKEDLYQAIVEFYSVQQGMTVQKLYEEWIEYKKATARKSSYIAKIKADWRAYYKSDPEFISKDISKLTVVDLELWANGLIKKYNMTKTKYYNTTVIIRQGLKYAVKKGYIDKDPFSAAEINTKLFKNVPKADSKTQVYTIEEQEKMEKEMWRFYNEKPEYTAPLAIIFMFYTGLRIGELVALRESDIEGDYLHVQRQETRIFEDVDAEKSRMVGYEVVEHTKTEVGNRSVPLPPIAKGIIKEVQKVNKANGWYDDGYLFLSQNQRIKHGAIEGRIVDACERIGIPVKTAHKFRKTYISTLYDEGVPLEAIREIVGHADERTTLHNYCFNRFTDKQTYDKVVSVLEKQKPIESGTPWDTKIVKFSEHKKSGKPA